MRTYFSAYSNRKANARIAGFAFLLYIAVGVVNLALFSGATGTEGTAATLANIAQHATDVRISVLLVLLTSFLALVLSIALYAITREQDRFLAMVAMTCRVGEGVIGGIYIPTSLGLLSLATAAVNAPDTATVHALGSFLLAARVWNSIIAATFFAVGSTLYAWLLLRGRMVPVALASLGVLASTLLLVGLPLQLVGVLPGSVAPLLYLPMALFEVPLGLWLLFKGVGKPAARHVAPSLAD